MKVLVVEDEMRIARSIQKGLEQEKFVVDVAYDGVSGYDLATTEEYDCIVLDWMMPEMDGMEVCIKLRAAKNTTPILMLTARTQTQDKVKGLNTGADDYLAKPFSFDELIARIRALTRRPKTIVSHLLKVRDISLNPQDFTVKRKGARINLSQKEYQLLEYLMKRQGTVLSKQQIIEQVWDFDSDVLPNTVEVYIKNLRKKVDSPFPHSKPLIHTVRGFGYKIQ
jgi:DNA-binding response OmpR family regulator